MASQPLPLAGLRVARMRERKLAIRVDRIDRLADGDQRAGNAVERSHDREHETVNCRAMHDPTHVARRKSVSHQYN